MTQETRSSFAVTAVLALTLATGVGGFATGAVRRLTSLRGEYKRAAPCQRAAMDDKKCKDPVANAGLDAIGPNEIVTQTGLALFFGGAALGMFLGPMYYIGRKNESAPAPATPTI